MDIHAKYRAATPYERRIMDEALANEQRLQAGVAKVNAAMVAHQGRLDEEHRRQARNRAALHQAVRDRDERVLRRANAIEEGRRQVAEETQRNTALFAHALRRPTVAQVGHTHLEALRRQQIRENMLRNMARRQAIRHARSQVGG
jgi:hypothetical protein